MKKNYLTLVQELIDYGIDHIVDFNENQLSDRYHTFDELYEFRKQFNAALFNEWALQDKYEVHKSYRHYDKELCFGGGWFIVIAILPSGQISNHYKIKDWNLFKCREVNKAKYPFDGHTPQDVLNRLDFLNKSKQS